MVHHVFVRMENILVCWCRNTLFFLFNLPSNRFAPIFRATHFASVDPCRINRHYRMDS